eukprot:gene3125-3907_t
MNNNNNNNNNNNSISQPTPSTKKLTLSLSSIKKVFPDRNFNNNSSSSQPLPQRPSSSSSSSLSQPSSSLSSFSTTNSNNSLKLNLNNTSFNKSTTTTTTTTATTNKTIFNQQQQQQQQKENEQIEIIKSGEGQYLLNNYNVRFPFEPYQCQAQMITMILKSLDNNSNCILESPTGTASQPNPSTRSMDSSSSSPTSTTKGNNIDIFPSLNIKRSFSTLENLDIKQQQFNNNKNVEDDDDDDDSDTDSEEEKEITIPKIYFCSRTHSQIKQLTNELNKTPYKPNMVVLASREHYCINHSNIPSLGSANNYLSKKEKCKKLKKDTYGCKFEKRDHNYQLVNDSRFLSGGQYGIWDIENFIQESLNIRECPYYASRDMLRRSDLIFCPYNYLIDPNNRGMVKDHLKGSIVIFDEAHNIEDALIEAASLDVSIEDLNEVVFQSLKEALNNTEYIKNAGPEKIQSIVYLYHIFEKFINWINSKLKTLSSTDFENQSNVWNGDIILSIFNEIGIKKDNFSNFKSHVKTVFGVSEDDLLPHSTKQKSKNNQKTTLIDPIHSKAETLIESFSKVIQLFFSKDEFAKDYKLVLQRITSYQSKQQQQQMGSKWKYTLGIWAMSPRIAFHSLSKYTHSIVLTSGTLSPLYSFQHELSSPFPITAELGNLPDIKSRVWIGTLSYGTRGVKLDATFKPSESLDFQDSLGESILKHIKLIPNGILCFFPSYGFMEKILDRWHDTGMLAQIAKSKSIYREPKTTAEFKTMLSDYYNDVKINRTKGAIMFAVCRGKVSEGIDFSDEYARGVIIIGIPYPNKKDLKVSLKFNFNNEQKKGITGSEWYNLQAYRALNQAIGRCIRHKNDYGSILLIDERFTFESNWKYLSKWARICIENNKNLEPSLDSLSRFYQNKQLQ